MSKISWLATLSAFIMSSITQCRVLEVDFAAFGSNDTNALASFVYTRPLIEMAVEDLNQQFNGTLKLSVRFISDDERLTCLEFESEAEDLFAKWYYQQRRPNREALSVVISPGT